MKKEVHRKGEVLVFKPLDRRLDALVASEFKGEVIRALEEAGSKRVVLDLSEVDFVDSSGLGALVSVLKQVAGGGRLVLCGLTKPVQELMELTRLHRIFDLAEDLQRALEVVNR